MSPPDAPPPLLLVSQFFPPAVGGSAVLFENVYSRLGRDVHVLTDPRSSPGPAGPQGAFRIHHAPLATPHWGLLHPAGLIHHARTAARIRRAAPSGAAVHCARVLPEGVAAWMARKTGGPRYVCWSHGEDLATASLSRDQKLTTQLVLRGADASLANSRNTADLLRGLGVPEREICVAYPGVDCERFRPDVDGGPVRRRLGLGPEDPLLLSVGRLQRRKGQDLVIRAMAELAAELPRLRYAVVGTGEEETPLRELAAASGVADRVVFAGKVDDDDLPSWYAASDVFVLANRREGADIEGFGIVFLEAQAMERPVIAGASGGPPEAIADGETGFLVNGTDASELAAVIRRLAGDEALRARMGRAGRERVRTRFTWERAAAAVEELTRRLEAGR